MASHDPDRRDMLKTLLGFSAAMIAPAALGADVPASQPATQPQARDRLGAVLPQRKLGRRGPAVTMLGLGGAHLIQYMDEATAEKTIETALAGGVRFFDTAASYGRGGSEERYGKFLTPQYRDVIFLMTKSAAGTGQAARQQLDDSLRRLKTDYLDLWQMHTLHTAADADARVTQGVLDVMLEAQAKGKVKHLGFTGHVQPESHLRMLELAAAKGDPFTTCQMPVNLLDPSYRSFVLNVIPRAVEQGVGVLAMKTLANGGFFGGEGNGDAGPHPKVVPDRVSIADAIHFVWSLPVSVLITGARDPQMIQEKIDLAKTFSEIGPDRRKELIASVADMVKARKVESYKG
jgi:aryl-alcohol dehydrogenase-like predicted oxidoreductase